MSDTPERQTTIEEMMARAREQVGPPRSVYDDAPPAPRSLDEQFLEFHRNNPHIKAEIVKLLRRAQRRGITRIGIKCVWETMRYNLSLRTYAPDGFKLNNNLHSRYARLIRQLHPDLGMMLELRELKTPSKLDAAAD